MNTPDQIVPTDGLSPTAHGDAPAPPAPLVYVYAIAVDGGGGGLSQHVHTLGGLGDPPRLIRHEGLAAIVADVPQDTFSSDALKEQLENLERLEALARAHHGCIEAAASLTTLLPLRLTTVYVDDARVAAMLSENAPAFRQALELLTGQVELGVKIFADPEAVPASPAPTSGRTHTDAPSGGTADGRIGSSPGRDYLKRRRAQRTRHTDTYRVAGVVAQRALDTAAGYATAHIPHRLQQGALGAARGENLVNDAYLVPAQFIDELAAALKELVDGTPGVAIEVTGPWVPYSFTEWAQTQPVPTQATAGAGRLRQGDSA
ncbi:GvpL/GvpF family gas vesicle protein [Streptomyces sp. NBC_01185]|uniref:GvpL/GvpF family gas vesicle protein n=1 Tax=Streptomyces sp. NBC_01185 TaxID=2903764 RepID=UPI00386B56E6|nr:GvpL/GvpF family gas vesicle protein [Streptomyces sp. NBC_01185]